MKADGSFEVTLTEPATSNGTLRTWFAFEDGTVTGNGKLTGHTDGILVPYTYTRRGWTFN